MANTFNWPAIRARYMRGETAYSISKSLGGRPSKQGIQKRASKEGWQRVTEDDLAVAQRLPIAQSDGNCVRGSRLGLRSPENVALILHCAELGLPNRLIAQAVGFNVETLRSWCREDPQLLAEMQARRSQKVARWIQHIDDAAPGDWRAADRLLQTAPETRDQFSTRPTSGNEQVRIVLNIDRGYDEARVIEGKVCSADG